MEPPMHSEKPDCPNEDDGVPSWLQEAREQTTRCNREFACLKTGCGGGPCPAKGLIGGGYLEVSGDALKRCPYRITYGDGSYCRCPIRVAVYKNGQGNQL